MLRATARGTPSFLASAYGAGTRVLLGDPGRNYSPVSGIVPLATYAVPTTLELEDREIRQTSVYQLIGA